jgi:catechol 2,3-dioxygenase-like lactoylglutathione lyase family enzyme
VRIHHLAFRTTDVARLEHFYVEVLDLTMLRRDGQRSVWLDAAGTILMLERREPTEPSTDVASKELVCFAIKADEHGKFVERLAAAGVAIEARTAYTLYFRDPDGRRIGVSSFPDEG